MQAWRFTPQGKFYCHTLRDLDDLAEFFQFKEGDREPWLKYDSCGYPLINSPNWTTYTAYYNGPGKEVNVPATRMLIDLELFEVRRGESLWRQCVQGDILLFRTTDKKIINYDWDSLCYDWASFFRIGDTPYTILEKQLYSRSDQQVTRDWLNILYGDPSRLLRLWQICYGDYPLTASSHDKIVAALLGIMIRRLEPKMWEKNDINQLF